MNREKTILISVAAPDSKISLHTNNKKKNMKKSSWIDDDIANKIRSSSELGRIRSTNERNQLKDIHERAVEKTNLQCERIIKAGEIAKRRENEGLEVKRSNNAVLVQPISNSKEGKGSNYDINPSSGCKTVNDKTNKSLGGYNVSEYDFKEYSFVTKLSSQNREYKSIYD